MACRLTAHVRRAATPEHLALSAKHPQTPRTPPRPPYAVSAHKATPRTSCLARDVHAPPRPKRKVHDTTPSTTHPDRASPTRACHAPAGGARTAHTLACPKHAPRPATDCRPPLQPHPAAHTRDTAATATRRTLPTSGHSPDAPPRALSYPPVLLPLPAPRCCRWCRPPHSARTPPPCKRPPTRCERARTRCVCPPDDTPGPTRPARVTPPVPTCDLQRGLSGDHPRAACGEKDRLRRSELHGEAWTLDRCNGALGVVVKAVVLQAAREGEQARHGGECTGARPGARRVSRCRARRVQKQGASRSGRRRWAAASRRKKASAERRASGREQASGGRPEAAREAYVWRGNSVAGWANNETEAG